MGVTLRGFSHAGGVGMGVRPPRSGVTMNEPREEEVGECASCWVAKVVFEGKAAQSRPRLLAAKRHHFGAALPLSLPRPGHGGGERALCGWLSTSSS